MLMEDYSQEDRKACPVGLRTLEAGLCFASQGCVGRWEKCSTLSSPAVFCLAWKNPKPDLDPNKSNPSVLWEAELGASYPGSESYVLPVAQLWFGNRMRAEP